MYPIRWQDLPPVSNEESRKAYCPKCRAVPRNHCRYRQSRANDIARKTGTNCENSHIERKVQRAKDLMREIEQERKEQLAAWLAEHGEILSGRGV